MLYKRWRCYSKKNRRTLLEPKHINYFFIIGSCHYSINFKSKGKCRKGDACPFSHSLDVKKDKNKGKRASEGGEEALSGSKRRRVDGSVLVEKKKAMATQRAAAGAVGELGGED